MRNLIIFLLVAVTTALRYDGYHQLKVGPLRNRAELDIVHTLKKHEGESLVVFLTDEIITTSDPVMLAVHPALVPTTRKLLKYHHIPVEIVDTDIQKHMDAVMAENEKVKARRMEEAQGKATLPDYYMTYDEQVQWLNQIADENTDTETFTIGLSTEGRQIVGVTINGNTDLPVVWFDAGIHAREWLSPSTALWIIHTLLTSTDINVQILRRNHKFYFAPNINPDGYEFTWTTNRLWRKNRSTNPGSNCIGTDLNRNWNSYWGGEGASAEPCSDTYRGSAAFSEVETNRVASYLSSVQQGNQWFYLYIAAHTYSQYWLSPWGGTRDLPADYSDLLSAGQTAIAAIQETNNPIPPWRAGSTAEILYLASGISVDWAKEKLLVKYSYTPELRPGPNAPNGFDQPASEIPLSGTEIFNGFQAIVNHIGVNPPPKNR